MGLPTTFVRLSTCKMRCAWCDTSYSFTPGKNYNLDEIMEKIRDRHTKFVCITGGEPLLQKNVYLLIKILCDENFTVSLETGGGISTKSVDPRAHIILDVKCPGSGMSHHNLWENLDLLRPQDEIKFVLKDRKDYEWAKNIYKKNKKLSKAGAILFSPVHEELPPNHLAEWILEDKLPVRLNLQLHKYIWPNENKGV